MKLTVTVRIVGGFALMLLLLLGLLITGYSGMARINYGLDRVTTKATPMTIAGGDALTTLYQARGAVATFYESKKTDNLDTIQNRYREAKDKHEQSQTKLKNLAEGFDTLTSAFKGADDIIAQVFSIAPAVMDAHRKDLEAGKVVVSKVKQFNDMSDEIEGNLSSLQNKLPEEYKSDAKALFQTVRDTQKMAVGTLDKNNLMAALATQKKVEANLNDAQALIDKLKTLPEMGQAKYLQTVMAAFTRFKGQVSGQDNFLTTYAEQLKQRKQADTQLEALDKAMEVAEAKLRTMVNAVARVVDEESTQANTAISTSKTILLIFFAIAIAAAAVASYLIVNSIRKPLSEVVAVIQKLAAGDLRQSLKVYRQDELGVLADNTNQLASKLHQAISEINQNAERLSAQAEQTADISHRGQDNANMQKEQTEQFATAMSEMASTVREVADSAHNTLREVENTTAETKLGKQVVDDNVNTINTLAAEMERAATVITALHEHTDQITSVLTVIRNIANQTNLLALNAAIEAARAGEQGRGFAVVADEVRTLASRTQESTKEIQSMIESLQSQAKEAVAVMQQSQHQTKTCVEKSVQSGQSIEKITQAIITISDMSTQIASAAEEQSATSEEMHRTIVNISNMADENAASANENMNASRELSTLADGMRKLVNQFTI